MADFIEIADAGGTKRKISVDEIESQFVQRLKMQFGADGSATDVSSGNPLPVADAATKALLEAIAAALAATIKVGDGSGALTIDGSVSLGAALPAGTNNIGDVDVASLPELPAGTKAIGQTDPRGNKAHDEADAGNPIKTGGRARTALAAAVAQDDRSDFTADKHGRQLVTEYPRDQKGEGRLNLTNATETTILEAAGASTRWVVTGIIVTNSSASVETKVEIKDDTTAKVIVHAGTKGGGAAPACPPGGFFIGGENKTVKVKCITTGADVEVFVCGYKIPA